MGILKWLGKLASDELFDDIEDKIGRTVEETKFQVQEGTKTVLKTITLWAISFIGLIFMLVGAAQAIESNYMSLAGGYGFLIVGAILVVFTLLVKQLK